MVIFRLLVFYRKSDTVTCCIYTYTLITDIFITKYITYAVELLIKK